MLPLRKHAQHAFFAVLAASLCGCFGAAELRARRHDLQQRRFHADVFAGTGNVQLGPTNVWAGPDTGKNAGHRRTKRQQPNTDPNTAPLSADFVGVIDQRLQGHTHTVRYRFVTLPGRGQFEWVRMNNPRTGRSAQQAVSTRRGPGCPFTVRPIGRGNMFRVTVNGTGAGDQWTLAGVVRSADGDVIEPLSRQGVFRVVPTGLNASSPCHAADCDDQFDVDAVDYCQFLVVRRQLLAEPGGAAQQPRGSTNGVIQREGDIESGPIHGQALPMIARRFPAVHSRLAEGGNDGQPMGQSASWIQQAVRRASAGHRRVYTRQATRPVTLQFPRIMSTRFHLGDRLLDKLSGISQQGGTTAWGAWGPWGSCSVTCGSGGMRTRTRSCTSSTGRCHGVGSQQRTCGPMPPCYAPTQATWGAWSPWSCSVTCGIGTRSRTRHCSPISARCVGTASQTARCFRPDCATAPPGPGPRPGTMRPPSPVSTAQPTAYPVPVTTTTPLSADRRWSQWSACSVTCGIGRKGRVLECRQVVGTWHPCTPQVTATAICVKSSCDEADWQDTLWVDLGEYTLLRCDYSSHADLRSMFWVLPDGRNVSDVPYTNGVRRYQEYNTALVIFHAQEADAGVYHCVADIGWLISRDVPLGVRSCSNTNRCQNSGTCVHAPRQDSGTDYEVMACRCPEEWKGANCDVKRDGSKPDASKMSTLFIALIVGALVLLLCWILAFIIVLLSRKNKTHSEQPETDGNSHGGASASADPSWGQEPDDGYVDDGEEFDYETFEDEEDDDEDDEDEEEAYWDEDNYLLPVDPSTARQPGDAKRPSWRNTNYNYNANAVSRPAPVHSSVQPPGVLSRRTDARHKLLGGRGVGYLYRSGPAVVIRHPERVRTADSGPAQSVVSRFGERTRLPLCPGAGSEPPGWRKGRGVWHEPHKAGRTRWRKPGNINNNRNTLTDPTESLMSLNDVDVSLAPHGIGSASPDAGRPVKRRPDGEPGRGSTPTDGRGTPMPATVCLPGETRHSAPGHSESAATTPKATNTGVRLTSPTSSRATEAMAGVTGDICLPADTRRRLLPVPSDHCLRTHVTTSDVRGRTGNSVDLLEVFSFGRPAAADDVDAREVFKRVSGPVDACPADTDLTFDGDSVERPVDDVDIARMLVAGDADVARLASDNTIRVLVTSPQ